MAEVVTFVGYRPPVRYDAVPWTEVRIQESATEDGTYTQLEAIPLSPGRHGSVAAGGPVVHDRARHSVRLLVPDRVRGRDRRHQRPDHPGAERRGRLGPHHQPVRRCCRARPRTPAAGGNAGASSSDAAGDPVSVSRDRQLPGTRTPRTSRPTRRLSCRCAWSGRSSIGSRSSHRSGSSRWAATRRRPTRRRNTWRRHANTLLPLKTEFGLG